ncbi:hypothetical protein ACJX0J_017236 [Zea mays]
MKHFLPFFHYALLEVDGHVKFEPTYEKLCCMYGFLANFYVYCCPSLLVCPFFFMLFVWISIIWFICLINCTTLNCYDEVKANFACLFETLFHYSTCIGMD